MNKSSEDTRFSLNLRVDSYGERFKKLFSIGTKIIYIKNEFDNSTFRYRCYNMVQALESQKDFIVTYFLSSELNEISKYIDKIDLIIFQRAMWDINIDNFIYIAKNKKTPIIYDIDDLILNPKYVPLYLNNLGIISEKFSLSDVYFTHASRYFNVALQCDGFITTNKFLGSILAEDFSKPVWIIQNFLNKEQEYHSKIVRTKDNKDSSKFVLGYFSGSPSHRHDFAMIANEIAELFEKYNNIFLKIVGFIKIPTELRKFEDRIIQKPLLSYEELQYEIGKVDLNLVPLQNNLFNNCKSELKYFEASIVNVVSCCSPTYIYKQIIKDKTNGFLCREGEWSSTIEQIYLNRGSLKEICKEAYKDSIKLYGVSNQYGKIINVYKDILGIS